MKLVDSVLPSFYNNRKLECDRRLVVEKCICNHSVKCEVCLSTKVKGHEEIIDKVQIHEKVCRSGLYNYEGCKIQVNHLISTDYMRLMLGSDYYDLLVCDFLKYGFPIGFSSKDIHFAELEIWKCRTKSVGLPRR